MTVVLAAAAAALFGLGTYLVLQRKLSRTIIGLALLSHGANVLLLASGSRGVAPLVGLADDADLSDPLPQAMALTTGGIVIGAIGAFLLTRLMTGLLFNVKPGDPLTFLSVAFVLGLRGRYEAACRRPSVGVEPPREPGSGFLA